MEKFLFLKETRFLCWGCYMISLLTEIKAVVTMFVDPLYTSNKYNYTTKLQRSNNQYIYPSNKPNPEAPTNY